MDVIALGLDGFATTVSGQIFPLALALWCECCYSIKGWASNDISQRTNNSPIEAVGRCQKL